MLKTAYSNTFERDPRFIWKSFHWKSLRVTSIDLRFGSTKHFEYQKPEQKRINAQCTREKNVNASRDAGETSARSSEIIGGCLVWRLRGMVHFLSQTGLSLFLDVSSSRVAKTLLRHTSSPLSWRKKKQPDSQNTDRDAVGSERPRVGSPGRVEVALVNHDCCSCWPFPGLLSK